MGHVIKISGLALASALLAAASPALAGGHFGGRGFVGHMSGHFGGFHRPGAVAGVHSPAVAGFRSGYGRHGYAFGYALPHPAPGYAFGYALPHGRPGYDFGYALPYRPYYPGFFGGGFGLGYGGDYYNYAGGYGLGCGEAYYAGCDNWPPVVAPIVVYGPYPPYPVDYYGASDTPTGNGVFYNLPPTPERVGPEIIYISHHHARRGARHHLTVIRGGEVTRY